MGRVAVGDESLSAQCVLLDKFAGPLSVLLVRSGLPGGTGSADSDQSTFGLGLIFLVPWRVVARCRLLTLFKTEAGLVDGSAVHHFVGLNLYYVVFRPRLLAIATVFVCVGVWVYVPSRPIFGWGVVGQTIDRNSNGR